MLKAILIDCVSPQISPEERKYRMQETESLIRTYGGIVLVKRIQKRITPNYKTYLGSGKLEEILEENKELKANIIIINNELKPRQIYNISEIIRKHDLQVWDRIDLILKIFQKHASTKEAKLEIELASIKHMGPRIFGMGIELSRQAGGIGTRGRGETNIEFMKRHLARMEKAIKKDLAACKKTRKLQRDSRKRKNLATVGIIGYTNAGKTSLLNALTGKGAVAADKLFATLDTRIGEMYMSHGNATQPGDRSKTLISDTIGFIQDLPPQLIKSFSSTLEETIESDLLLHVIDINDPNMDKKIKTVNEILGQIHALHKPTLYVFNKIDLKTGLHKQKSGFALQKIMSDLAEQYTEYSPSFVSTVSGAGIERLQELISKKLANK